MEPTIDQLLAADTDLERFFLDELAASVARQVAATTPWERSARAQVSFALFLDCVDLGLGARARAILAQCRDEMVPTVRAVAEPMPLRRDAAAIAAGNGGR